VELQRRASGGAWAHACNAPCDELLLASDEYRMVQAGRSPRAAFRLKPTSDYTVVLKFSPTSTAAKVGGGVLIALGSVVVIPSVFAFAGGLGVALAPPPDCSNGGGLCGDYRGVGALFALVGGVGLLLGGGMVVGGATVLSDSGPSTTQKHAAAVREPTWVGPRAPSTSPTKGRRRIKRVSEAYEEGARAVVRAMGAEANQGSPQSR
jgi:hypothetical protein